ncbi:MAG: glycerophosphodiester phosphodiesterase [Myxococcaceae bacterium]
MRILGHRGASADAPENTLPAFELALAEGADGVELDARLCASGEVVVFHDEALDRLTGRPGRVVQTPWSTLRTLEVRTAGGRARIPLLGEVLEALPRTAWVNVELKADSGWLRLAARVARLLVEGQHQPHVVVSSFQPLCLLALGAVAPSLRRGFLIEPGHPAWVESGPLALWAGRDAVHPSERELTEERVRLWHARGREVSVWTVDEPARAKTLASWGVDSVITNRPGALRAALGRP